MRHPIRHVGVAVLVAIALVTGGCAFDPADVPVPGSGVPGPTYRIQVQFTDVLNLPMRAKVFANGAQVGTVSGVRVVDPAAGQHRGAGYAVADLDIQQAVRLPESVRVELRQQTVLGDVHVALISPPGNGGAVLADGATVPMNRTSPAGQVEDTMAALATFVNGGAIEQFQNVVDQLGAALPADPAETARRARALAVNATDLAANQDDLDTLLAGLAEAGRTGADSAPLLADVLVDGEVQQLVDAVSSLITALGLFGRIAEISRALTWLAPALRAGDAAAKAFMPLVFTARPFDTSAPSNLNLLVGLLRDKIIPWVQYGMKANVASIRLAEGAAGTPPPPDEQVDRVVATLRMIGAIR
ncbi:MlaD family protein [Nocardia flavorosea]|uniref:MCE family protein n=1 Tax=Nocardia flavorosea TaxID=53429 RepID=A0A846YTQ3_9NOCA|nr:MlaD family protein [Nocardia flavorosea]NKY61031.1 MCE family protein [Nocardia flavorosea]